MEAARGITKQIAFDRNEVCETCKGARTKPNAQKLRCSECEGTGVKTEE